MLSLSVWPKVITLSGFYCMCIFIISKQHSNILCWCFKSCIHSFKLPFWGEIYGSDVRKYFTSLHYSRSIFFYCLLPSLQRTQDVVFQYDNGQQVFWLPLHFSVHCQVDFVRVLHSWYFSRQPFYNKKARPFFKKEWKFSSNLKCPPPSLSLSSKEHLTKLTLCNLSAFNGFQVWSHWGYNQFTQA
jgi:hypothetical protein